MKTFIYTVADEHGIHARPAGLLISCAKRFASDIKICKLANGSDGVCEKEADGKRLLSVMSLGARCGDRLKFTVSGVDEDEAAAELQSCCDGSLGTRKRTEG